MNSSFFLNFNDISLVVFGTGFTFLIEKMVRQQFVVARHGAPPFALKISFLPPERKPGRFLGLIRQNRDKKVICT